MKKRLLIIALLVCIAVVAAIVVSWALPPSPGVTVENFRRLQSGMREEQVIAILGEPGEDCEQTIFDHRSIFVAIEEQKRWVHKGLTIEVLFYSWPNGRSAYMGHCTSADGTVIPLKPYQPTLWDRVHSWLLG